MIKEIIKATNDSLNRDNCMGSIHKEKHNSLSNMDNLSKDNNIWVSNKRFLSNPVRH